MKSITGTETNEATMASFEVFGLEDELVGVILAAAITAHPSLKCWAIEEAEEEE